MSDAPVTQDLRRELGFWDALTIGAGTMIGAGIFLLSGVALELTGPGAIFSYIAAGVVCMITASSAAELATGMPTSGGDYYFVSRSLGPALGAISGIGIWLSLTFAIAFYLYGMGEYLGQILPLTPLWGALLGGVALTVLNLVGAKESGRTQVVVVLTLIGILAVFSVGGLFRLELSNLSPFLPYGTGPVFSTTALVFVSFLGFVKIAAVAEEIREPAKNLPRALVGSVALVTVLYVAILLVLSGIFPQETIVGVRDPLTSAARTVFGTVGGLGIILAGLLATVSSANASIMASSRINLAMARDRMVPRWLSGIHEKFLTPHRAILLTGLLALCFLALDSLEDLAKIASVLQLYSYAALNVGCVALRASAPEWYRPPYRTPGSPFLQLLAAAGCVAIVLYSGPVAQAMVLVLIVVSLAWYVLWGRSRVEIRHALPDLRARWALVGPRALIMPPERHVAPEGRRGPPPERPLEVRLPRKVVVALANPEHEGELLRLGRFVATGAQEGGEVVGVHFVRVPIQTPLEAARRRADELQTASIERTILRGAAGPSDSKGGEGVAEPPGGSRPVGLTRVEAETDVAHDVFDGLVSTVGERDADLLLMGWQGGFNVGRIYRSPVQRVMSGVTADIGVLKTRGLERLERILIPWGGGMHARLGLELAVRIAGSSGAAIHVLRVVRPDVDREREEESLRATATPLLDEVADVEYLVQSANSVTEGIDRSLERVEPDLLIIGASRESRIRNVLFGSIPDVVADRAPCSVLMVRHYVPKHWSLTVGEGLKRVKETLGMTTSPGEEGARPG